jgi:twitching motility protein PilT
LRTADGKGRAAAQEILIRNAGLSNLIREGNVQMIYSTIQSGRAQGMQTMDDALMELVKSNKVSAEDAFLKANEKARFEKLLKGAAPAGA